MIHWKVLKSFSNYRFTSAINHGYRQFSDTGSANYVLQDRTALLQLYWINIFCRDVRVSWNQRSASCYHINMKASSLVMTPGSEVQYKLSAAQHLTVAGIQPSVCSQNVRKCLICLLLEHESTSRISLWVPVTPESGNLERVGMRVPTPLC